MDGQLTLTVIPTKAVSGKQVFICESEVFPEITDKQYVLISVDEWREITEKLKEK